MAACGHRAQDLPGFGRPTAVPRASAISTAATRWLMTSCGGVSRERKGADHTLAEGTHPPLRQPPGGAMMAAAAAIQFTDIGPDDPRLAADILPVLRELRPHLTAESLTSIYAEGHPQGLRFTGAYIGSACIGVAGWRNVGRTFCGRQPTIQS